MPTPHPQRHAPQRHDAQQSQQPPKPRTKHVAAPQQRPIPRKPTLSRPDVAAAVAAYLGVTATQGRVALDGVIAVLRQLLAAGHAIELRGFGNMRVRWVKPHRAVNPKTRAPVAVPGRNVVVVTPSSVFLTGKRG